MYLIAGNWKMNGLPDTAESLASGISARVALAHTVTDIVLCPPTPLLAIVAAVLLGGPVHLGAQDCHTSKKGRHTGDVAAPLLAALGCKFVIVGHSERRADHGETNPAVKAKAQAALDAHLTPIICVGETEAEREADMTADVISTQISGSIPGDARSEHVVVAYEPVWAIGTGRTATEEDIATAHAQIRKTFGQTRGAADELRILYGGSVNGTNAASILRTSGVNGALVGGASLNVDDFWSIVEACP